MEGPKYRTANQPNFKEVQNVNYIITGRNFTSNLLHDLDGILGIKVLTEDKLRESDISFNKDDKLYVPSQSSLEFVIERTHCPKRLRTIELLSDKYQCRSMMKPLFPEFYFETKKLSEIKEEMFIKGRKYIIKPSKGFFGMGVKIIDNPADIYGQVDEIQRELDFNSQFFSESVFSREDMIIEQFIEGDEYAVDMFYSEKGEPVIVSITYHPMPLKKEYHHVLYYTNNHIFQQLYPQIESFFTRLNSILNIHSFPIHAEFKLERGDLLLPIELNPLRYGGFGLADLSYYAYGQCPYFSFFHDQKYNWKAIWNEHRQKKYYAWVLAYNGTGMDMEKIDILNAHAKLQAFMGDKPPLYYQELDYRNNPVFAIVYLAEEKEHLLTRWLDVEFQDFFL